jgi:xylulokinase
MAALADATGVRVDITAVPEGAARGAAWTARMAAGLETDIAAAGRWSCVDRTIEPSPSWVDATTDRYARFLELSG